jgi:hypothetical protein
VVANIDTDGSVHAAASIASSLVAREETRARSRMAAYRVVAGKVGRSASWLRGRLLAGRLRRVDAVIRDKLHVLLTRELESEIARLTHELEVHRQRGTHLAADQVCEVEAHLSAARALLTGRGR